MSNSRTKRTPNSSVERLATAIRQATRSAKFLVAGRLPVADPGLEVEGLGRVPVPLKRGIAKALIVTCRVAPYGKGTETLIDTRVRKTFELDVRERGTFQHEVLYAFHQQLKNEKRTWHSITPSEARQRIGLHFRVPASGWRAG